VRGLTASDFALREGGQPRKIAFFEAESEPISLAILIDSGRSMDFGGKRDRAQALLASLIRGNRPEDEIFLIPFTDEIGPFQQLTPEQRLRPPAIAPFGHRGSALYDALAAALCHMRTAKNIRQAVVVITDGVDQHSRLQLEQLIELVRSSSPQVFMVGLYNSLEY
jgi:VWFA-related protein